MSEMDFLTELKLASKPLLGDGAMGTVLNAHGAGFEQCFGGFIIFYRAVLKYVFLIYQNKSSLSFNG